MSRVKTGLVQVDGLKELDASLKAQDPAMRKVLREANKEVATVEAEHARSAASGMGSVAAKSAPAISASVGFISAGVSINAGGAYPFAFGAFFGGQGRPTTMQFQSWIQGGYVPFPQIQEDEELIVETYTARVSALLERLYPD